MNTSLLPYTSHPETLFTAFKHLEGCVWLDSGKPASLMGRYDIISALPSLVKKGLGHKLASSMNQRLVDNKSMSKLPFCGGWIGFIEYNEQAEFGWYDWGIVVDHENKTTTLFFLDSCLPDIKNTVQACLNTDAANNTTKEGDYSCSGFKTDQSKSSYLESIRTIQNYLRAGDCYQVNYTQRFSAKFLGSSFSAYKQLRQAVPSPFSAYIKTDGGAILSISPERFIKLDSRSGLTQPIKGTIARGATPAQDLEQKKALASSEKDLSENVMIVDLLRNDFNKHCEPFSVKVPQLFEVQSFANVHHLVSTITGTLKTGIHHIDFLLSSFPGGSITGAPKKRSMEVIDELEQHPRGIYCGVIGYLSCNNKSDFNIAIRTLELKGDNLYAWAGGGVVLDSDPELEYQESLDKIGRLLRAVETTEYDEG